jgi:hypothetical protein
MIMNYFRIRSQLACGRRVLHFRDSIDVQPAHWEFNELEITLKRPIELLPRSAIPFSWQA